MSTNNDNLAYNSGEIGQAPLLPSSRKREIDFKAKLAFFLKDGLFFFMVISLLLKSILFIGLVNNNGTNFSALHAFKSFSSPPPLSVYVFFIVIFLSFTYLFKGKRHYWALLSIDFVISLFLIVDLMYFRGFGSFLTPFLLSQSSNLDNLFSSIISMLRPVDLLFVVDLLVLGVIGLRVRNLYARAERSFLLCFFLLGVSISGIYYQHVHLDIKGNGDTMLFRVAWAPNQTLTNLSPLGYHLYDLYNYYEDTKPYTFTVQESEQLKTWFDEKQENLPPNQYAGLYKGENLLVIQVESLENSVINQRVNGQEITPNLNKLLSNSLYFSNYYEQVYNGNSSDAELMTNTSVYPARKGATFFRFPQNTYNSLPKLLESQGYNTQAIHADKGALWNWQSALQGIGFQKTTDASYFNQDEQIGLGVSDGSYLKQVVPLITEKKYPFYTFMVTLSSHSPFELPEKFQTMDLDEKLNKTKLGGYFQSIHYTDEQLGTFLTTLEEKGILENTTIAIYGDHTGVHKYYDNEVQAIEDPESWYLDNSKRIPLIIYHKGLTGQEIKTTGGQIDLLPTLAYLMGIPEDKYSQTAFGRNLLNTQKDFAILANGEYKGTPVSVEEQNQEIQGIALADLILRSNYLKDK
ncbi:LTA synthase family protein [Desulfitobacterium metallireducens]|uniref:Phosphoglycerol transferase n=1 Tax=Desulfitobacterium metallireducens DSM 15288 TaxID=871968 RepID=W0EBQ3_9FIRM|nr:LTA synthase family protein [Desulfitobacterium metallireducens]AHF06634.1 phosphoglycerol transferase [Desulfitobacterium metallireducens DSM 15288]